MYASMSGADNGDSRDAAAPYARRLFYAAFAATLILKLLFAAFLPMTGDEAYFVVWGMHPALGYYDHPPMVGWWLSALLAFGHAEWWLRLPAVLLNSFIGWAVMRILRPHRGDLAYLAGTLYLIAPVNLYNVLVTTDTPVILFIFLAGWAYYRALTSGAWRDYVLAGCAVGFGMLSKYFEGLVAVALGAHWLLLDRRRRGFFGLLLTAAVAALLFGQNLWWNYNHCWDNFLFNLVNRTHHGLRPEGPPLYLLSLLYLFTPPLLFGLYRARGALRKRLREPLIGGFALFAGVPLALFGLLSFKNNIGLHWLLGFYPFVFVLYGALCGAQAQRKALRFMAWFAGAHVVLLATILALPTTALKPLATKFYPIVVLGSHTDAVWKAARPYAEGRHLATRGYATAGILEYHTRRHFAVFGTGSDHGREDDSLTDFRRWDGKNVLIVSTNDLPASDYAPYFASVRKTVVVVDGARISLIQGNDFKYSVYYEKILRSIRESYYRFPAWLPVGRCPYTQRYFGTR